MQNQNNFLPPPNANVYFQKFCLLIQFITFLNCIYFKTWVLLQINNYSIKVKLENIRNKTSVTGFQ